MLGPAHAMRWVCTNCGDAVDIDEVEYTCPRCGPVGLLDLDVDYDRVLGSGGATMGTGSMWRYRPLLPLRDGPEHVRQDVGWTPLVESDLLARAAGVRSVAVKDEGRNPSGSLKDRASAVVMARAIELGYTRVVTSSSGNAAVALAAMAAGTRISATVFVPGTIPDSKLAQLVAYGAEVFLVEGGYEAAVEASLICSRHLGWYSRNTAFNPFTTQGKKTVALEFSEQCGDRGVDAVVVPTGDGNILTGVHAGCRDALALGWLPTMPRLLAVQAAEADPIYHAWRAGASDVAPRGGTSTADSINVADPQDGVRALRAVRETGGAVLRVDEEALAEASVAVASTSGVFAEPAAAAAWAGLLAAREEGLVDGGDRVVVISTGSGLKDSSQVPLDPVHRIPEGREVLPLLAELGM